MAALVALRAAPGARRVARGGRTGARAVSAPAEKGPLVAATKKAAKRAPLQATSAAGSELGRKTPTCIEEVDNGQILGFSSDLGPEHPGGHDTEYKARRLSICNAAAAHVWGTPIPDVEYNADELATWATVFTELSQLFPANACKEYMASFPVIGFEKSKVPQLANLSDRLQTATGWQIRPVAGLLHPRDFLNGLAFKVFHSTQYVRHHSQPMYTPEPDVCHELMGHVPMFANKAFSDMVHAIGVASLGASDKAIWHLTKVYWYTVEFGVVMEDGQPKAFGAGILSSFGELEHMASGGATISPLDPYKKLPKMSYKDGFQKHYFSLDSFESGAELLQRFANEMQENGDDFEPWNAE